jgi:transposase
MLGADEGSDTCRFQTISIAGAGAAHRGVHGCGPASELVAGRAGGDHRRELYRGRDGVRRSAPARTDAAATFHLASTGARHAHGGTAGVRSGGRGAGDEAASSTAIVVSGIDRARDRWRGRAVWPGSASVDGGRHYPCIEGKIVIGPSGGIRVMVATNPVDFRKGAEGLAALVREVIHDDPFSGVVYVFRAKRSDRIKLIFWDGTGVVLVAKRLEGSEFRWPKLHDGVMRLSAAQFSALFEGLDWRRVHELERTVVPVAPS